MLYSQIHPRSNHASTQQQQQQQHTRFLVEPNADYEQSDDQQIEKSLIDLPCKPCEVGRGICQLLTADPGRTPFFFFFVFIHLSSSRLQRVGVLPPEGHHARDSTPNKSTLTWGEITHRRNRGIGRGMI